MQNLVNRLFWSKNLNHNACRFFALKLASKLNPEELLATQVFDYIKQKNGLPDKGYVCSISNIFDEESGIKQLNSVIVNALEPSPSDVIKLFYLYSISSKASLFRYYHSLEISKILQFRIETAVPYMSFFELYQFSIFLQKLLPLKLKFFHQLSKLSMDECTTRANSTDSLSNAIKLFLISMEIHGNNISNKEGYSEFISVFEKYIETATVMQLAHLLYFVGLAKRKGASYSLPHTASNLLIPSFDNLPYIDAGIAVLGIFRLGLKFEASKVISNKVSATLTKRMHTERTTFTSLTPLESFAFVSLVKYHRFALNRDDELLKSMKAFLTKLNDESWNAPFVCHILALYANSSYYDFEMYSLLKNKFFQYLKSSSEMLRIKDISRTMWALSHVQHPCSVEDLNLVVKNLEEYCSFGELLINSSHVVDSILALAVLSVFPETLFKAVLHPDVFQIMNVKHLNRRLSRLLLLSEIQKVVFPTLFCSSFGSLDRNLAPQRTIADECFHRPCIKRISDVVRWINKVCDKRVFKLEFIVPHIHYCSLVVCDMPLKQDSSSPNIKQKIWLTLSSLKNLKVAIDVNDANTSLVNVDKANGLEQLKRNLLKRKGWSVKVLSQEQIELCGDDTEALAALILCTIAKGDE